MSAFRFTFFLTLLYRKALSSYISNTFDNFAFYGFLNKKSRMIFFDLARFLLNLLYYISTYLLNKAVTQTLQYPDKSFQVHLLFPLTDKQHNQTRNTCLHFRPSGLLHTKAFRLRSEEMRPDCHMWSRHRFPLMSSSVPQLNPIL